MSFRIPNQKHADDLSDPGSSRYSDMQVNIQRNVSKFKFVIKQMCVFLVPRRPSLLSNSTRDFMGRMKSGVKDALHPVDLAHANEPRWLEQCSVYIVISSNICLFQLENYLNSGNPPWRYQVKLIKFRLAPLCCSLFVNKRNTQSYMFSLPHATSPCIFALYCA